MSSLPFDAVEGASVCSILNDGMAGRASMNRELPLIEKELQPIESWVPNGIAAFEVEMVPFFGDPSVGNFLTCVS